MGCFPLFVHFVELFVTQRDDLRANLANEIASLKCLLKVTQLMRKGKLGFDVMVEFNEAMEEHGRARILAYGERLLKFKFHLARHIWDSTHRDGFQLDCFAPERVNKRALAAAEPVTLTKSFELTVLTGV